MTTTKLPTDTRSLVRDPDLAAAIDTALKPHSGEKLERAQVAVRGVRMSGVQGTFGEVLAVYQAAILKAVGKSGS